MVDIFFRSSLSRFFSLMILWKNPSHFAISHLQVDLKSKQRQLEYTLQEDNIEDRERERERTEYIY